MRFFRLKHTLIALLLILLVGTAVVLRVDLFAEEISVPQLPPPNTSNPNDITTPGASDTHDSLQEELPYETEDTGMPSSRYPTKILNYCIQKLYDSKGYKQVLDFGTVVTATVAGVPLSSRLSVTGYAIKSEKERYEYVKFLALDELSTQFSPKNNLQATYTDGSGLNHFWETPMGVFDMSRAKHSTWTAAKNPSNRRWYYDFLYADLYGVPTKAIEFTSKNSTVSISTQKNATTGKSEYVIKVKMADMSIYPEPFLRAYGTLGRRINITSIEQTLTFVIDKNSGWIINFVENDIIKGGHSKLPGVVATCNLVYAATYSHHDQLSVITHPPIPTA